MKEPYEKPHMIIETVELATLAGCYGGGFWQLFTQFLGRIFCCGH